MMTEQTQGARMLTLGERIVQAARLATEMHLAEDLHQSVDQALEADATSIEIGGADPVSVGRDESDFDPYLLANRHRQAARRSRRRTHRRIHWGAEAA